MGVAGSGKTTVGRALATALGVPFLDADELHSPAEVAQMADGRPLTERQRAPWVAAVATALAAAPRLVCACSALSRHTRDALRGAGGVGFVELVVAPRVAEHRVADRPGHFMGPGMVASQFEALEVPTAEEADVLAVGADGPPEVVVARVVASLGAMRPR
jgi:gluconokinase